MPGSWKGRVVDCDAGAVGVNNTPLVKVVFEVEGKKLPWTGWFSDKINEKTNKTYTQLNIEQLVALGFNGKCVSEMSLPGKNVETLFDTNKVWNLEVDYQTDKNGKILEYLEVKWINDPNSGGTSKLDHATAVTTFKGMNLGGMLNQAKRNAPKRVEAKEEIVAKEYTMDETATSEPAAAEYDNSDIPF